MKLLWDLACVVVAGAMVLVLHLLGLLFQIGIMALRFVQNFCFDKPSDYFYSEIERITNDYEK